MFMLPLFALFRWMAEQTPSLPPSFPPPEISILGDFNCHHLIWDLKDTSDHCGDEVFNWVISSDLLPLNNSDIPNLLHRSLPDISFAPPSLALSCSWEVLQDLSSDHLPILLTIPLHSFTPTNVPLPSFKKLRWNDFSFDFRLSLSPFRGILVSFSFLCCCSLL